MFRVACHFEDTLASIKDMIQNDRGIPVHFQRLSFAGQMLEDGHALRDYNIKFNDTVNIGLRLSSDGVIETPDALPMED